VAAVYGTTPEELVGKTDADFNSNQEEVAAFRRADQAVIQSGRPLSVPEEPVTGPTGETRWFQTIKVPLSTGDQTRQILGVATDITDRKQLEEQLRQAQKMEAIGRLAGGVAHDFNNLITVVMGHAELLLLDVPPDHPHRWELEEIRAAARRAAGLTQQLLAFSRRQVLQPRVVDLNELVTGMSTMLRRLMGEDIELRTVAGTRLGPVHADPGQLEQVLMNLVVNARDAMPLGGIVTIETANVDVDDPRARPTQGHYRLPAGSYVLLAVADSGEGVDAEVMAHLFEPFFTTKGPGKGTGLGLATVYGIVKQSEGHILVDSEPGQGATFRIYLPRVSASAPADAPAAAAPVGGTETVLVVEDEPSVLRLSCSMLNLLGYHVLAASNGEEALTMAAAFPGAIHILITDVVMPKTGGRELAERLRVVRPGTKVLYVSGYTDDAILRHGVLDQGVAFLQKPFTAAELAQMVRQVLDAG
jgi:PAS domain S-box-containing protein